jgi:small-conductance mechanosensitive channel
MSALANDLLLAQGEPPSLLSDVTSSNVMLAVLVVVVVYVLIWLSTILLDRLARKTTRSRFIFKMLTPVVRFGLWIAGLAVILFGIFAPTPETTLAMLASVGLALGFGAQDLVKNIIGGLVILVDRPFQLGDKVRIGDAYGEVDQIGLRSTKLTTGTKARVTIPNSDVLSGQVWNVSSGAPPCMVVTDLYLPPNADPILARNIAEEAASSSPYNDINRPIAVLVEDGWADSAYMKITVRAWVYDHRMEAAFRTDVTVRAKKEYIARGLLWEPGLPAETSVA